MDKHQHYPRHELLGSRALDSNSIEITWKNALGVDEVSWLAEHVILDRITFPAVGYIAMIGECMRQLSDVRLESYSIKDFSITSALILSLDEKVELSTKLRPLSLDEEKRQWYEIQISSYDGNQWIERCVGVVSRTSGLDSKVPHNLFPEDTFPRHISPEYWYDVIASRGLKYGTLYRGLRDISTSLTEHKATATISPSQDTTNYTLHPVTIDQCLQILMISTCNGQGRHLTGLSVITAIKHLVVLSDEWTTLKVGGQAVKSRFGGLTGDLSAVNEHGLPILSMEHCIASLVPDHRLGLGNKLFSFVKWDTDVTYHNLNRALAPFQTELDPSILLERLTLLYALNMRDTTGTPGQGCPQKLQELNGSRNKGSFGLISDISPFAECEPSNRTTLTELLKTQISGTELSSLGTALEQLLTTGAPFSENYAERRRLLDQIHPFVRNRGVLADSLRLLAHKNPKLRVLELGNSTSETTLLVLKALKSQYGDSLCLNYTYASTSSDAINEAMGTFKDTNGVKVVFFDIAKGIEKHTLQAGAYDLIITTDFISREKDAKIRAEYLRQLIHPHGHVILLETIPEPNWVSLLKLYLSDGTSTNKGVPNDKSFISHVQATLLECGFIFDPEDDKLSLRPQVVAKLHKSTKGSSKVTLIVPGYHHPLVRVVEKTFNESDIVCDKRTLEGDIPQGQDILIFVDFDEPYLYNITETRLSNFVKFLSDAKGSIIWVTPSAQISCDNPNSSMILGMMRTIRSEFRKDVTVVEMGVKRSTHLSSSKLLLKIYQSIKHRTKSRDVDPDYEYAIVDGDIKIPRIQWTTAETELSNLADRSVVEESCSQGLIASNGTGSAPLRFRSDSSYLLVGGLGGLGRMVSTWMVENGARNIMFLSRSAKEGPETTPFFDELRSQGCNVTTFAGSVNNLPDVEAAVEQATKPIAGVMQMSAVMRDNLMSRMTFAEWDSCVQPKVQGTWNLHHATASAKLDFFLLFSSICGVTGQWGQGNYNSANSFLDAFVNYRHGKNLPASVADIGFMGSIGMAMESDALVEQLKGSGYYFLSEQHLIDALTIAIAHSCPGRDRFMNKSQLALGIRSTKPITSPTSRVAWKKDSRMAISHHFSSFGTIADDEARAALRMAYGIREDSD